MFSTDGDKGLPGERNEREKKTREEVKKREREKDIAAFGPQNVC